VDHSVTFVAQRDQIVFGIISTPTPELTVMNLKIRS